MNVITKFVTINLLLILTATNAMAITMIDFKNLMLPNKPNYMLVCPKGFCHLINAKKEREAIQ